MIDAIRFDLPTPTTEHGNETIAMYRGPERGPYRSVMVETDGTVRALDPVSHVYSISHDLSDPEIAEAQRLAVLVRSGSHSVVGGLVRPVAT